VGRVNAGGFRVHHQPVTAIVQRSGAAAKAVSYQRWVWVPSADLDVPADLSMPFAYDKGAGGLRRCFPERLYLGTEGVEEWIAKAFAIGLAILSRAKDMTAEQVHSYRAMAVLFAYRSAFEEHQARRFARSADLYIRPSGREDQHAPESRTVLSVIDKDLSVSRFTELGKKTAKSHGISAPTAEQRIQYGFLRWAEEQARGARPPSAARLAAAARCALFDVELKEEFLKQVIEHAVVPRLMKGIEKHRGDSPEDFGRWFRNAVSRGFVHLARQRRAPGGVLPDEVARQVVLGLIWWSYTYVGQCLNAFMHTVRRSFDPPLVGDEAELFDRQWLRQRAFGRLPLILVRERLRFMWPAIAPWLESPSAPLREQIVHRLLYAYAAISHDRREADTRRKDSKDPKRRECALPSEPGAPQATAEGKSARERLDAFLESRNVRCHKCKRTALKLVDQESVQEGKIRLNLECVSCHAIVSHVCPVESLRDELADVWRSIR
jgi:hypothetical protein